MLSVLALAVSGAVVASASGHAAPADNPPKGFLRAALAGATVGISSPGTQRDIIQPPSDVDPAMAIDPPQTGAMMPVIRPPGVVMPGGRLVLPH